VVRYDGFSLKMSGVAIPTTQSLIAVVCSNYLTTGRFKSSGKQSSSLGAVCCVAKYLRAFVFNGNAFNDWVINFDAAAARNAKNHLLPYVAPYSRKMEPSSSTPARELQ